MGHTRGPNCVPIFWAAFFLKIYTFLVPRSSQFKLSSEMHNADAAQAPKAGKRLMRL